MSVWRPMVCFLLAVLVFVAFNSPSKNPVGQIVGMALVFLLGNAAHATLRTQPKDAHD